MRASIGVSRDLLRRVEALEQVIKTDVRRMIAALTDEDLEVALSLETEDEQQRFIFDTAVRTNIVAKRVSSHDQANISLADCAGIDTHTGAERVDGPRSKTVSLLR